MNRPIWCWLEIEELTYPFAPREIFTRNREYRESDFLAAHECAYLVDFVAGNCHS